MKIDKLHVIRYILRTSAKCSGMSVEGHEIEKKKSRERSVGQEIKSKLIKIRPEKGAKPAQPPAVSEKASDGQDWRSISGGHWFWPSLEEKLAVEIPMSPSSILFHKFSYFSWPFTLLGVGHPFTNI